MDYRYESLLFLTCEQAHNRYMFLINCPHCTERQLASSVQIQSIHRTSEGMLGYVRCTGGHVVLHRFETAYPKPKPPASVIALRNRQAAAADETSEATKVA